MLALLLGRLCIAAHAGDSALSQLLKGSRLVAAPAPQIRGEPACLRALTPPALEPGIGIAVRTDLDWGEPSAVFYGDHWTVFLPNNKSNPDPCRSAEILFRNMQAHIGQKDWEIIKQHVGDEMSGFVIRLEDPLPSKKGVTGLLVLDMSKARALRAAGAAGRGGNNASDFMPDGPVREAWDKEIRICSRGQIEENPYAGYHFQMDSQDAWACMNAEGEMRNRVCELPEETKFRMVQEAGAHVASLAEAQMLERVFDWCRRWVEGENERFSAQMLELRSCQAGAPSLPKEVRCRAAYLNADYLFDNELEGVRRARALEYYGLSGLCPEP